MLCFEQSKNEAILEQNLLEHGCSVNWQSKFIEFEEFEDHVEARIEHQGESQIISCKYKRKKATPRGSLFLFNCYVVSYGLQILNTITSVDGLGPSE